MLQDHQVYLAYTISTNNEPGRELVWNISIKPADATSNTKTKFCKSEDIARSSDEVGSGTVY